MEVHIRYNGISYDTDGDTLDIGDLSSDDQVRAAAARYVDTSELKMANFQVDREENAITLRPQAVFGN